MQGGPPPPCTPRRSAGCRPIGQEISKIRGGNMKQNPLKSRGLWGVREWNRKKMYPSGWKHYAWVKKTLRRTFVSLWKNCFSPFGRKNNHFFLGKQKFASEFFCPWHKVSTQKEHIFLISLHFSLRIMRCLGLSRSFLKPTSTVSVVSAALAGFDDNFCFAM